jgi:hypothetical protein
LRSGKAGQVARSKRKKRKGKAASFLLLAGLTLLIAGFIARREIPGLIRSSRPAPQRPAQGNSGRVPGLAGGGENLHSPSGTDVYADGAAQTNQSGEHITGSERRALDALIKQKSR